MMLQALLAYAERENFGDADFASVGVRWLLPFTTTGGLAGPPIPLSDNPGEKKPRPKTMLRPFTSPNELTQKNNPRSYFLCDTLARAAFYLDAKAEREEQAKCAKQHEYFKSLLTAAAAACPGEAPRLKAVVTALDDTRQLGDLHKALAAAKAKPADVATVMVDGSALLDSLALKTYWRARRAAAKPSTHPPRICLATGNLSPALDTHEKIAGIPGANPTGANLISFDKDSFCSFGLSQGQNAALSAPAELRIRSALAALVAHSRKQQLVFGATIFLHWTRRPVVRDPFDLLATADPDGVKLLLESARRGALPAGLAANDFYAATLSGNGARIVVRDWIESTVPRVEWAIAGWFEALAIADIADGHVRRDFSLYRLLNALANPKLEKPYDALPHGASEDLLAAALGGGPLSPAILAAAIRREIVDRISGSSGPGRTAPLQPARFALVKLCLLRSPNRKEHHTVTPELDPESKDAAYLCGQLFAVLGRLQLLALGKVGASIAERTYGGVATRPATALGPIFTKAPAYLKKANDRFPGAGTNKQKEIESLCSRLEAQGGLPVTLGLEEQGRFALGYYCQLAAYRTRRQDQELEQQAAEADESL